MVRRTGRETIHMGRYAGKTRNLEKSKSSLNFVTKHEDPTLPATVVSTIHGSSPAIVSNHFHEAVPASLPANRGRFEHVRLCETDDFQPICAVTAEWQLIWGVRSAFRVHFLLRNAV